MENSCEAKESRLFAIGAVEEVIKQLQGEVLTIVDASFQDKEQRKAAKDLVNKAVRVQFGKVREVAYRDDSPMGTIISFGGSLIIN